ncbi:MAG: methionine--tRNA ligase [Deltaproteobacteria bacterium]|nr:methionine--tRNA ligase [Deltaproteobacteria bacterium]
MTPASSFYITTPIYYVTGKPHIGNAYTTLAADIAARFQRLCGQDVFFLTGTDEHGQKVLEAAKKQGLPPQALADEVVQNFHALNRLLQVTPNDFIRTTEERHRQVVLAFLQKVYDRGDIYLGEYEDWYCLPCEAFYTQTQLIHGKCPSCQRDVQKLKEESYFFRMSNYEKALLEHLHRHAEFVQPETRRNEVIRFVESGLKDLSISRTTIDWGIPVPNFEKTQKKHVLYVWFDALINYLSGIDYLKNPSQFELYWNTATHLVGKDILRFHAVYWPCMLLSVGLPLPKRIFAHGWITHGSQKMSKSRENALDPFALVEKYGLDPVRYYFFKEIPFGLDGEFSDTTFIHRTNSDLANDLGNLLSRSTQMVLNYCEGKTPAIPQNFSEEDEALKHLAHHVITETQRHMDQLAFSKALSEIWKLIRTCNQYLENKAPWKLAKEHKKEEVDRTLYICLETLRIVALLTSAFMPTSSQKIWNALGISKNIEIQRLESESPWGQLPQGLTVQKGEALFPRIATP